MHGGEIAKVVTCNWVISYICGWGVGCTYGICTFSKHTLGARQCSPLVRAHERAAQWRGYTAPLFKYEARAQLSATDAPWVQRPHGLTPMVDTHPATPVLPPPARTYPTAHVLQVIRCCHCRMAAHECRQRVLYRRAAGSSAPSPGWTPRRTFDAVRGDGREWCVR